MTSVQYYRVKRKTALTMFCVKWLGASMREWYAFARQVAAELVFWIVVVKRLAWLGAWVIRELWPHWRPWF